MCRPSLIINRVCECVFTSGMWITEWEDEVKLRWSAFKEEAAQGRTAPPDVVKSQTRREAAAEFSSPQHLGLCPRHQPEPDLTR